MTASTLEKSPSSSVANSPSPGDVCQLDPPSLRRRGPARLDVSVRSGEVPRIGRKRVHVWDGQTLIVQVVPQQPNTKVAIRADPPIIERFQQSSGGPMPTFHAEFAGHFRFWRFPFPSRSRIHVFIADGLPDPPCLRIPVMVWPSVATLCQWWLLAFAGIVGLRCRDAITGSRSIATVMTSVIEDLPFLGGVLISGFGFLVLVRLFGWVFATAEFGESEK